VGIFGAKRISGQSRGIGGSEGEGKKGPGSKARALLNRQVPKIKPKAKKPKDKPKKQKGTARERVRKSQVDALKGLTGKAQARTARAFLRSNNAGRKR